jgi:hypothetical protein
MSRMREPNNFLRRQNEHLYYGKDKNQYRQTEKVKKHINRYQLSTMGGSMVGYGKL